MASQDREIRTNVALYRGSELFSVGSAYRGCNNSLLGCCYKLTHHFLYLSGWEIGAHPADWFGGGKPMSTNPGALVNTISISYVSVLFTTCYQNITRNLNKKVAKNGVIIVEGMLSDAP